MGRRVWLPRSATVFGSKSEEMNAGGKGRGVVGQPKKEKGSSLLLGRGGIEENRGGKRGGGIN